MTGLMFATSTSLGVRDHLERAAQAIAALPRRKQRDSQGCRNARSPESGAAFNDLGDQPLPRWCGLRRRWKQGRTTLLRRTKVKDKGERRLTSH